MTTEPSNAPQTTPEPSTQEPINAPGRNEMPVENRAGANTDSGSTDTLSWGARSDVGLVRSHNEDSFLVQAPLFVVCDGMGGHAAGEVASSIAVQTIAEHTPTHADDILLGVAVEDANTAVLEGSLNGTGKPGMGCTATCVYIENNKMAVAHVGDSRIYLLHGGTLVRITHDHSYVEELVDSGEITADEARIHPSRSIITRALGSDPDMYADHFTLDVSTGDRIIMCSDGLSSMVPDKDIEELAVSSVTPQAAADTLVSAALTSGGHDNVTVVVIDVVEDGLASLRNLQNLKRVRTWIIIAAATTLAIVAVLLGLIGNSWYVGNNDGTVGVYRGVRDEFLGVPFHTLTENSSVEVSDLPNALQNQINEGIIVSSAEEGHATIERYRDQIDDQKTKAARAAEETKASAGANQKQQHDDEDGNEGEDVSRNETGDATPSAAAQTGKLAADEAENSALAQAQATEREGA